MANRDTALMIAGMTHGKTQVTQWGGTVAAPMPAVVTVPNEPDRVVHAASVYLSWLDTSIADPATEQGADVWRAIANAAEDTILALGRALETLAEGDRGGYYVTSDVQKMEAGRAAWIDWKAKNIL